MTIKEFDDYKLSVAWRHIYKTRNFIAKIRLGTPYKNVEKEIKEIIMLDSYLDILLEYNLPESIETNDNFLSPDNMKYIALKINKLTGLRYNYNFIKD